MDKKKLYRWLMDFCANRSKAHRKSSDRWEQQRLYFRKMWLS